MAALGKRSRAIREKLTAGKVFELDETATDRDIRKQWRKLALKWHPDREQGNAERFREVCEAWQTLRD